MTTIAVNAMILDEERLSGIGHYVVKLVMLFGRLNMEGGELHRVLVICRDSASRHLADASGVELITVRIASGRIARVWFEQFRLPLLLRQQRTDVLLNPAFTGPLWGARRILTTVHDLYYRTVPQLLPPAQRRFLSLLVPWCCRRSWRVITPSNATRDDLVRYHADLAERTVAIPLANRLARPQALVPSSSVGARPFVLLVAALTGNKNAAPLVAAVARLRERHPGLWLLHIGKDPDRQLAQAVERHSAERWVQSCSGVTDAELEAYYRDCLCLAIPSLYEGFGLPLLEAQAAGAPVVSSNRGSLPEIGGDGAIFVDPTSIDAIADAIEELIVNPERRQALREAGFANQARFSWERTSQTTWNLMLEKPLDASAPFTETA